MQCHSVIINLLHLTQEEEEVEETAQESSAERRCFMSDVILISGLPATGGMCGTQRVYPHRLVHPRQTSSSTGSRLHN